MYWHFWVCFDINLKLLSGKKYSKSKQTKYSGYLWNQIFWERFKYCNTKVGDRWHFSTSAIDAGLQKSSSASRTTPKSCPHKVKNWKKLVKMGCPAQDQLCTSPISQKNWVCLHFGGLLAAFFVVFLSQYRMSCEK